MSLYRRAFASHSVQGQVGVAFADPIGMSAPYLSVVMIAKNEQKYLPQLFTSLNELAPIEYEVCLVDTGSTDATIAIARENGARVQQIEWADNYGAARNVALDMARGTWALSLDADEFIEADGAALLRELKQREKRNPTQFAMQAHVKVPRAKASSLASWKVARLIRVGRARWERPIHEGVRPFRVEGDVLGPVVPETMLTILNEGLSEEERTQASMQRKEQIMERLLRDQICDGDDPNMLALTYFDLARSYVTTQPEKAGEMYRQGCEVKGADQVLPKLQQYYAQYLLDRQEWEAAEQLIDNLERVAPCHGVTEEYTAWQRGCLLLGKRDGAAALKTFRDLGEVSDVVGIAVPANLKLRRILYAAALAGDESESIAAAVKLVGGCADGSGAEPLMMLWQARPIPLLVQLLKQAGAGSAQGPTLEAVAEALRTDPRGEKAAAALLESS